MLPGQSRSRKNGKVQTRLARKVGQAKPLVRDPKSHDGRACVVSVDLRDRRDDEAFGLLSESWLLPPFTRACLKLGRHLTRIGPGNSSAGSGRSISPES